jgi:hypothetical protein
VTAARVEYLSQHGAGNKEVAEKVKKYYLLMQNIDYSELLSTQLEMQEGRAMAPGMAKRLAAFDARKKELEMFAGSTDTGKAFRERVCKYEEEVKQSAALVAELTLEFDNNEKWLTTERAKMHKRPVQRQYEEFMAARGIEKQRSYTVQLVGSGVHLLCTENGPIMDDLQELLLQMLVDDPSIKKSEEEVRTFIAQQKELLELLHFLANVMKSNEVQSEERISQFDVLAKKFGELYREYYGKLASPKAHMLESEVPLLLALYKRLGLFSEEAMEREHQVVDKYMRMLASIPSFEKKVRLMMQCRHMAKEPSVAEAMDYYMTGKKRIFSAVSIEKAEEKEADTKRLKSERLSKVATKYGC